MNNYSQIIKKSILEKIEFIASYAGATKDWAVIKKELLKQIPPEERKLFSKRDQKTKKLNVNELETAILSFWKETVGVELIINGTNEEN